MNIKTLPIYLLAIVIIASSCGDDKNEDVTETVNKNGSIESSVTVQHLDSVNDILVTKHAVWVKGNAFKNIEYRDTVPALGTENTQAENQDGDTKNVTVKKDYEIFITVK
jgi:hypothetical protein